VEVMTAVDSSEKFVEWSGSSDSVDFLFEFIEVLDSDLFDQKMQNDKVFQNLNILQNKDSLQWKSGEFRFDSESHSLILELLDLVNEWFGENSDFFGAMTHPELIKERIRSWPAEDVDGLNQFREYVDYWWNSDNRESFIESFEDSLALRFGNKGKELFDFLRQTFDNDELLDALYNFIAYRSRIDTLIEVTFTDSEDEELICPKNLIDDVLYPYIKENRILIPLLYEQQNI
jgi:hypothetical protein